MPIYKDTNYRCLNYIIYLDKYFDQLDPWFDEFPCYFGSWRLTHEIPKNIKEEALKAKYIWISHFHPDHLNLQTLRLFKNVSKILLAKQC